jgi:hypothetical protein
VRCRAILSSSRMRSIDMPWSVFADQNQQESETPTSGLWR